MAVDYIGHIRERNVAPSAQALADLTRFDMPLPETPGNPVDTLQLLNEYGSPATTATTGGRFFGLVVGGTLPAALGARVLASAWDQIVFNDATSAIGVKLEQVAANWLLDIFGLPKQSAVGFVTGATMANFTCIAAARHTLLARAGWNVENQGLNGAPAIRVVASEQIHVTALKILSMLGMGSDNVEFVPCDANGAIIVGRLPQLDERTLVLTQAGNVNSGACDPIAAIAAKAAAVGAWVHVDGAFGLWAAASSKTHHLVKGYEAADSWAVDSHKWLNTPYDCGIAICKHPQAVHAAMSTQAPYLKVGENAAPKDMIPEFSRSARGVEVWAALHSLGRQGIADMIDRCCSHAQTFARELSTLGFEIMNDVVLNQVVASFPGQETQIPALAAAVRDSGNAWFGPTNWQGKPAIRISVSSWLTDEEEVRQTTTAIETAMSQVFSTKTVRA